MSLGWNAIGRAVASLALAHGAYADDAGAEKGRALAAEAAERHGGWGDWTAEIVMTLRDKNGGASERRIDASYLETPEGEKSLIVFQEPADVKGAALLTHSRNGSEDEQWLYLPAAGRVRRIASANKSGPFMGSEFAFEDLAPPDIDAYAYAYLGSESVDGVEAHRIERRPLDKHSGYARQEIWLEAERLHLLKADFFNKRNERFKSLTVEDYRERDGHWRPERMTMTNLLNGRSTVIAWENVAFRTGLTERDFDQSALQRAR